MSPPQLQILQLCLKITEIRGTALAVTAALRSKVTLSNNPNLLAVPGEAFFVTEAACNKDLETGQDGMLRWGSKLKHRTSPLILL